jgi:hypothetical protein
MIPGISWVSLMEERVETLPKDSIVTRKARPRWLCGLEGDPFVR